MGILQIYDTRMLILMAWAIERGLTKNESEYLEKIEFPRTNISNIRRGHQSFNRDHIMNACKLTGANANWLLGIESSMMRKPGKTPLEKIREALIELESDRKSGTKR